MSAEELALRRTIVCASGLLYWAGVLLLARRIRRRIGRSPNVRPRGPKEKALWVGWLVVILVWIGQPLLLGTALTPAGLGLFTGMASPLALVVGLALVGLGYAGTLWTYAAMGTSWRMGVNAEERTALVCHGPFRWVRHPIYLLQVVMLTGAALLLPTPLSFAALALHYLCVRFKVRDEENHLLHVHGAAYHHYASRTGGLFPRWRSRQSPTNPET
jgi:protein-S-isoprenylcysteine O-methyltransferase Ste14